MRGAWTWGRTRWRLPKAQDADSADRPCVIHLVRKANGLDVLRGFAEALRAHPPGLEHELVLAMKGFDSPADAQPYLEAVEGLDAEPLFFEDRNFDLGVYLAVAARLKRDRYCFIKSTGRPLVDGWLATLDSALDRPGVGQVGACGAWTSLHSWLTHSLGLPSAYRGLLPPPRVARELLRRGAAEQGALDPATVSRSRRALVHSAQMRLRTLHRIPEELMGFAPFPNPHLRTTAFMLTHETLSELDLWMTDKKEDTFALESGRRSITAQLRRLGLLSLVVDRYGEIYEPERWDRSRTFWQGDQEGCLVADNQTVNYSRADAELRRLLASCAWGPRADARPPSEHTPGVEHG